MIYFLLRSNCTLLELKLRTNGKGTTNATSSNCTLLELKQL